MPSPQPRTGSCLDGLIRYTLSGPSSTPLYNTCCHCLNCRRWVGAAVYNASICPKEGFQITQGEDKLKTFTDTKTDSGKPLSRAFCGECGSHLFAFTPLREDIVSVGAGTLDDFDEWRPDVEQYCIHRAPFLERVKGVDPKRRHQTSVMSEAEAQ